MELPPTKTDVDIAKTSSSVPAGPLVDEEIRCPLCDYNLRGLPEPRCPECGHRSTWEELREKQPRHPYLFERYPRRNVWSFFKTWWRSLWPRRFWNELSPTLTPQPRRLYFFALAVLLSAILGSLISLTFTLAGNAIMFNQRVAQQRQALVAQFTKASAPNSPGNQWATSVIAQYGSIQAYANQVYPSRSSAYVWRQTFRALPELLLHALNQSTALILLWPPLTLASLMIFRASLRQARIKSIHVTRCIVYTLSVVALLGPLTLIYFCSSGLFSEIDYRNIAFVIGTRTEDLLVGAPILLLLGYRLAIAYEKYLRFDRPYLTVLASQAIVILALLEVNLILHGF